jgi:glycosyltransferase involved in cell wall biosynthesis
MPTVSVLMPVHNADRYVAQAVESILGQRWDDWEFLVIDDGSTDRSRSSLERYDTHDHRIRLTSRPNTGYTVALNEPPTQASGEFVARMDADDVALPNRPARQVEYLRAGPGVVWQETAS